MIRRNFIKTLSASALLGAAMPLNMFAKQAIAKPELIKPKRIKPGDTVGLISPAGFIKEESLKESTANLENLGFKVVHGDSVLARNGYLGGTDKQRADDVNAMFARKDVDGIICTRGGYGCARMLSMLDYDMIKNNPKIILGYSDVTALCCAIYAKTGIVTFHGPVGTSTYNDFSVNNFKSVLMYPSENFRLFNATDEDPQKKETKVYPIRSGKTTGELAGGNLSILCSLIGTKYDIDTAGKILFIEEVEEQPYRVDRMLTQMIEAGKFANVKGVAFGVFSKCDIREKNPDFPSSFTLSEVLMDRMYSLNIPVIYGMSFGHIINKFTLPFGIKAELDVDNQCINLLEPAVL
jgi:Uncharacterized proteins, homologs of microcin C7 resistance protein MccF